jgi:hypothetical protein
VLILQATFVDKQGAEGFWLRAAEPFQLPAAAAGFIRRFSFADGPLGMLIAFWRTQPMPMPSSPAPSTRPPCGTSTDSAGNTHTLQRSGR